MIYLNGNEEALWKCRGVGTVPLERRGVVDAIVRKDPGKNMRESTGGWGSGSRNGSSLSCSHPSIILKIALLHLMASLSS